MKKNNTNYYIYLFSIIFLFIVYFVFRGLLGFDLVSDEIYYLNEDPLLDRRRRFFLYFAQIFDSTSLNIANVLLLNFIALLTSYHFLSKINSNNYLLTFFQLIYVTSIANYILRDTLVFALLFISISFLFFLFDNYDKLDFKNKIKSIIFILLPMLLISELRFQFVIMFFLSIMGAFFLTKHFIKTLIFLLLFIPFLISNIDPSYIFEYQLYELNTIFTYDVSIYDFLLERADRWDVDFSLISTFISSMRHIFAPIPTSLIFRIISPEIWNDFGLIDDIYRLIYRTGLYFVLLYIFLNVPKILAIFFNDKFKFSFLALFSLQNIFIYSLFAAGGGHERVKICSYLIFYFIFAKLIDHNNNTEVNYQ